MFALNDVTRLFCDITILTYAVCDSVTKKPYVKIFTAFDVTEKISNVTVMTLSTQNQCFYKILENTNPHAKFGAFLFFGLGVK